MSRTRRVLAVYAPFFGPSASLWQRLGGFAERGMLGTILHALPGMSRPARKCEGGREREP